MVGQKEWIQKHKREFINDLIKKSGAVPDDNPSAIFMAGLPGAGKTEFSKNLISNLRLNVVRLDMDEIATNIEGYKPEAADKYREGASSLLNGTFDAVVKQGLDFIMDGTFSSKYARRNVNRAINHGYSVKIIYIYQDPKLAWRFTLEREKVEHRSIDLDGFIESYFNTIQNVRDILSTVPVGKIALDIILKDSYNKSREVRPNVLANDIDKIINNCYDNKEQLRSYLNG